MSEKSSGDDIRLKCLSTVLRCCIGTDVAKIEAMATLLRDDEIIKTKDERKAFAKLARAGKSDDAIELMISKVSTTQHGIKYFATALEDEDLEVDKRFSEILAAVLDEERTNETKLKLVSLWGELVSFQQDIKPVVEDIWPNHTELRTEPWPLRFIHFCVTTQDDDLQKVEAFVSSVNFLPPQAEAAKDVNLPDDEDDEFLSEPPPLSIETDEPESFVVVNEEGEEEGDGKANQASTSGASAEFRPPTLEATDGESEGNQDRTSGAGPMLTSSESQQILNQRIEDVSIPTVDSPGPSITDENHPSVYVSEESSLTTSDASIQQSPNGEEINSQTPKPTGESSMTTDVSSHPRVPGDEEISQNTPDNSHHTTADEPPITMDQSERGGADDESLSGYPHISGDIPPNIPQPQKAEVENEAPTSQDGVQEDFECTSVGGQEAEKEEVDPKQELAENLHLQNDDEDGKSKHTTADKPPIGTGQKERGNAEKIPNDDEYPSGFTDISDDISGGVAGEEAVNDRSDPSKEVSTQSLRLHDLSGEKDGGDQDEVTTQASNDIPPGGANGSVSEDPRRFDSRRIAFENMLTSPASLPQIEREGTEVGEPTAQSRMSRSWNVEAERQAHVRPDLHKRQHDAHYGGTGDAEEMTESMSFRIADGMSSIGSGDDIDLYSSTVIVQTPVVQQPLTSDASMAYDMQMNEALRASTELIATADKPGAWERVTQTWDNATNTLQTFLQQENGTRGATVQIRAFFVEIPQYAKGWRPALLLDKKLHPMIKHRLGYFYTNLHVNNSDLRYTYALATATECMKEYLPQHCRKRVIKLGGDVVTHDVAGFTVLGEKRWEKMVDSHMKDYLPSAKTVFISDFWFPYSDILNLINAAIGGWQLVDPKYSHKCKHVDIEQMLKNWLADIEQASNRYAGQVFKHVLCSLGVTLALYELKHTVNNPKLFIRICKGLHTHSLNGALQIQLFQKVAEHFQSRSDSAQRCLHIHRALEFLLNHVDSFPKLNCLHMLPLYWIIRSNGQLSPRAIIPFPDLLYDRAMLPDKKGKWEAFRGYILKNKARKLHKLCDVINEISKVHPWIVDTYQYFLSDDILVKIINEKHPLASKFLLDSVFKQILPLMEPLTFSADPKKLQGSRQRILRLSTYFNTQFGTLFDRGFIGSLTKDEKVFKAKSACAIGQMLEQTLRRVIDGGAFNKSGRLCILWLIGMACRSEALYHELGMKQCSESPDSFLPAILDLMKVRLSEYEDLKRDMEVKEIEFYNNLFSKTWSDARFQEKWINLLANEIEHIINGTWNQPEDGIKFLNFYLATLSDMKLEVTLNSLLAEKAAQSAKDVLMCHDPSTAQDQTLLQLLEEQAGDRIRTVFANAFQKEFRKFHQKTNEGKFQLHAIQFLVESPITLRFYRLFDRQSIAKLFSQRQYSDLKKVNQIATNLLTNFSLGNLTLEEVELMMQHRYQATELVVLTDIPEASREMVGFQGPPRRDLEITMLFETSKARLDNYKLQCKALEFFVNFCVGALAEKKIQVNCERLRDIYERKYSDLELRDMDETILEEGEMAEILLAFNFKSSHIFYNKAKEVAGKQYGRVPPSKLVNKTWKIEFKTVLKSIWKDVKEELIEFIQAVDQATLLQEEITEAFKFTDGDEKKLKTEITSLYKFFHAALNISTEEKQLDRNAGKKARQLAQVFKIQKNLETLKWFEDFRKQNNLKGDFEPIERFQATFQGMDEMNLQTLNNVLDIDKRNLEVLKTFTKQEALVDWIKSTMKEESNVRGLCLVAMESTRYDPRQADKWSFLADAVAGFDALLFNLDKIDSLNDLITRCQNVWKKVDQDRGILRKWSDVGEDIAWYKKHEKWYGSEEKAALHFAEEVNKYGRYVIANFKKKESDAATLKNSMKLEIIEFGRQDSSMKEEENESLPKDADIDYLHGIQSTLMLISSDSDDGKTEIKQFVAILNAMEGLAKAYADLVNAGFMLLSDWKAVARSKKSEDTDMMTEPILTLNMTFKNDIQQLTRDVSIQDVNLLSDILRDALKRWNNHISRMRLKHYFLNEYSIQQIKYLCGQLVKVREGTLEEQAYLLLSDRPRSTMTPIIHDSLNEAMATPDQEETGDDEEMPDNASDVSDEVAEMRNKRRAVRQLVNSENTSEALAKAAVQECGFKNLTDCCNWILVNQYDEDHVLELSRKFDQKAGFVCDQSDIQEDVSVLQSRSAKTLEGMIGILQQKAAEMGSDLLEAVKTIFVGYLKNTTTLTLKDCLSLNHLGKFLTILHGKMEEVAQSSVTQLPCTFKGGVPNFILTEKRGVIHLVLSLYANSLGNTAGNQECKSRLPKSTEVLLCSEDTTADEVERFMRLSMCKHPSQAKQLFCLAFAEKLNLNVSKAMETIFKDLSHDQHVSDDYQLVIISSDQHHYVSNCFDKYQMEKFPNVDEELIQSYVREHTTEKTVLGRERVNVVSSERSGVGKSLHVKRVIESLANQYTATTVRLLEKNICISRAVERLSRRRLSAENPQLLHIDLTPAVENGIEKFFFDLIILGLIKDSSGKVWRKNNNHSYIIEVTKQSRSSRVYTLELLPTIRCLTPTEALVRIQNGETQEDVRLMDDGEYQSDTFQRPYQYLLRHEKKTDLGKFDFHEAKNNGQIQSNPAECLDILLRFCGMKDPSWAQLKHFASFLNVQLTNCEKSLYCQMYDEPNELKKLAVKFMIKMAQDFATPSLDISDESAGGGIGRDGDVLQEHQIRRRWEENEHPYVFFNDDCVTMTFINVNIDKRGNLLDKDDKIIEEAIVSPDLVAGLELQGIELGHNFHKLTRNQMLLKLCPIMGIDLPPIPAGTKKSKHFEPEAFDPDTTYELTTDNVLKMIAIYMRFRCNIPVIIMGETGCGKTRMIEFMTKMQAGPKEDKTSMETLKVHGGIGVEDIFNSVRKSAEGKAVRKTLFYDEANTTTAIYAIKEVMCDLTIDGEPFQSSSADLKNSNTLRTQIVAACNPYKQLSPEALKKLESSGLGYRVATSETSERLGNIAMRTLVYRVVALPPSIQPFVWDFGQLSVKTEEIYIEKMVASKLQNKFALTDDERTLIVSVLSCAQSYMKKQNDECRYVSLRDVERSVKLYKWFYKHKDTIFTDMDKMLQSQSHPKIEQSLRCLLHAIGISYHVSLENREGFRTEISKTLYHNGMEISQHDVDTEYITCQKVFHRNLKLEDDIAWNEALRENVFLMAVCADVKLPLYLIGKPGSSKSLAKTIVEANMKGSSSNSPFFQKLRKVEVLSYQCSALTQADGIKGIFKDAANRQKKKDLKTFTSLVVLDEIGLAEDSPNMPLKILHPLLECGNADSGSLTQHNESEIVAFAGISNWALDPAKMNRGIFVTRGIPSESDLFTTATGIFQGRMGKMNEHHTLMENVTKTYLDVYKNQGDQYFGLRDYYSLIKMIRSLCEKSESIGKEDIAYVLVRNFSGGKERHVQALKKSVQEHQEPSWNLMSDTSLRRMVLDNIKSRDDRFLLLLTAQHSSVNLLQHIIPDFDEKVQIIFGSSFPGDHTYTEICKNINRIKVCMEKGKLAVLLNMTEIHESLYDVLNQHYVTFGDQRYVAIGLGSHRVWTRIHQNFRMIVIEKREIVHDQYPIPLINRLEKHHLQSKSLLDGGQIAAEEHLSEWSNHFSIAEGFVASNAFMGYNEDTTSSVVLAYGDMGNDTHEKVLLQVATADSVYRLPKTRLSTEKEKFIQLYMEEQTHDCLFSLLQEAKTNLREKTEIFEVVSFSNILTEDVRSEIECKLNLVSNSVMLLFLQQFKVEEEYTKKLDDFFSRCSETPKHNKDEEGRQNVAILLIQTAQAHANGKLIECAKHNFMNKLRDFNLEKMNAQKMIVAFILSTERCIQSNGDANGFTIQHTRNCKAVYVDELRHSESNPSTTLISSFYRKGISEILQDGATLLETSNSTQSHVLCLLQDCISEAMAKVTNSENGGERKLERVRTLRRICSSTGSELEDVGHGFLKILLHKMKFLFQPDSCQQDDNLGWITKEAYSRENLQEGGTFGKTMHLCLKRRFADMLAFVVSIIDENNNMSILLSEERGMEWKFELWLQLFKIMHLQKPTTEQLEYRVKTVRHLIIDNTCKFPFSSFIHEKFLKLFNDSEQSVGKEAYFYNKIKQNHVEVDSRHEDEISKVLKAWDSSNCMKMMQEYAYDLLKFQFKTGTNNQDELDAMVKIMFEFSKKIWNDKEREKNGIAVIFYTFMKINEHLSTLSSVFKICPGIVANVSGWVAKQEKETGFQIHEYALVDLLTWTHKKASEIKDEKTCMEWMNVSSQMKKTYRSLVGAITSEERKKELQEKSKPLFLLDMLFTHLLPWDRRDPDYLKYAGLIVVEAKKVFRAMETMGFYNKNILKIVTTTTRKTYEDLHLSLIMKWQKPICVCGKGIQTPVQMPCGGFICNKCADNIQSETRNCPRCTKPLPENFRDTQPNLSSADLKRLQNFQSSCTGFFLEYLHEYCFSAIPIPQVNSEDNEKLRALFDDTLLPKEFQAEGAARKFRLETTKLDLNIAVKSSILQLLMKLGSSYVENRLNEILTDNFKDDSLLLAVIKAFENVCADAAPDQRVLEHSEALFRHSWKFLIENKEKLVTYEILQHVAQIRYALTNLVKCVEHRRITGKEHDMAPTLILTATNICILPHSDAIRKFIAKTGLTNYSRQWLREISQNNQLKVFVSENITAHLDGDYVDYWQILGEDYTSVKSATSRAREILDRDFQPNTNSLSPQKLPKILGALSNKTMLKDLKSRMRNDERAILLHSEHLVQQLASVPELSAQLGYAIYQLALLAVGTVLCKLPMMDELYQSVIDPKNTTKWFWPAMPESIYHHVNEAMEGQAPYSCANGHVYYIGDCTYPDELAQCPESGCGAPIGGIEHIAAAGNQRLDQRPEAQCGYQIHDSKMGVDNPADRITEQAAAVIQFFVHSCMMMALTRNKKQILRMIGKANEQDGYEFIAKELQRNLNELSHGLGCSVDEAVLVLSSILARMTTPVIDQEHTPIPDWSNKNERREWEKEFRKLYLVPIFQEADEYILEAKKKIQQADTLKRVLQEEATLAQMTQRMTCFCPVLWKSMKEPTASHLLHRIADSTLPGGVLRTILQTPNLHLAMHLRNTLRLQETLIQRYQNTHDMKDAENITLHQVQRTESYDIIELIKEYIDLWNAVFPALLAKHASDTALTQYMRKIDINAPITMALPSARGRGRCAKLLAEYLIDLQNDFLKDCKSADESIDGFTELEVSKLLPSHFVCVNKQQDLLPMIHLHAAYSIITDEQGHQYHRISYNIGALEKQAKEKHVMYKKMIKKESLPCIKYAQDVGVGTDWEEVDNNVPQDPLPAQIAQEIDDVVIRVTVADVCEGVRTLTQAISFLAKVKVEVEDADRKLRDYLETDLMLSPAHLAMIPKSAKICHTLALYQKLSCHKAVSFVQQGLNPYKECLQGNQERITDLEILANLKEAFEHTDLNSLRQHLNEMLIKVPDFKPWWRLINIFPGLNFIEENPNDSWYSRVPAEVCFKHVADLFRLSVEGIGSIPE